MRERLRLCQERFAPQARPICVRGMRFTNIPYQPLTKHGLILAACFASASFMATLHSYPFCPQSRFARLILGELGIEPEMVEEKPWERRRPFLEINPAGELPLAHEDRQWSKDDQPQAPGGT